MVASTTISMALEIPLPPLENPGEAYVRRVRLEIQRRAWAAGLAFPLPATKIQATIFRRTVKKRPAAKIEEWLRPVLIGIVQAGVVFKLEHLRIDRAEQRFDVEDRLLLTIEEDLAGASGMAGWRADLESAAFNPSTLATSQKRLANLEPISVCRALRGCVVGARMAVDEQDLTFLRQMLDRMDTLLLDLASRLPVR